MKAVSARTVHTLESYGIELTDEVLAVFEQDIPVLPKGKDQEPLPELPEKKAS